MAVNAEVLLNPTPMDLMRVLVVDDDELFRESL